MNLLPSHCSVYGGSAKPPAVFGFDRSVGPNVDGEDEIAGGASFVEVAFAGEELAKLLHEHFGDFNLGLAFGGVGDDAAVFVAPSWDHSGEKSALEDGECGADVGRGSLHGRDARSTAELS